jgi:hypothetical protein
MYGEVPYEVDQANDEEDIQGAFSETFLEKDEYRRQQREESNCNKEIVSKAIHPGKNDFSSVGWGW